MKKILFAHFIILIILVAPILVLAGGEWYEGGTLHRATVREWNNATYANKLATASDWASSRPKIRSKVKRSGNINTLRPYADQLVECVNEAAAGKGYGGTDVAQLAASCMILMGW